jgi:hypothetical protein
MFGARRIALHLGEHKLQHLPTSLSGVEEALNQWDAQQTPLALPFLR